jgi:hypothetical protein
MEEGKPMICGVVRGLLEKEARGTDLKRFAHFQRLIIEYIALGTGEECG